MAVVSLEKNDKDFLKLTNDYRRKFSKKPLKLVENMCQIEKEHNYMMLSGQSGLGH